MNIKTYSGAERDRWVARAGCCQKCGFQEEGLVAWLFKGREAVHCHECFAHETCFENNDGILVYLPEMPAEAFSNYVRILSWASFAALTDSLRGHDFADGSLPSRFADKSAWEAHLLWRSLGEALVDFGTDAVTRGDLTKVKDASAFLVERIEYTSRHYAFANANEARAALGIESFRRDFQVMHRGITVGRIRSWGNPGSTFFMLANRTRSKK